MSTNASRPVTPAEIAWAKHMTIRDDSGLRVDPIELALLREIVARWKESDAQKGSRK